MSCPICGKDKEKRYLPFCSKRCADIDLAKWLGEDYAVPSQDEDDMEALSEALETAQTEHTRMVDEKLH